MCSKGDYVFLYNLNFNAAYDMISLWFIKVCRIVPCIVSIYQTADPIVWY